MCSYHQLFLYHDHDVDNIMIAIATQNYDIRHKLTGSKQ